MRRITTMEAYRLLDVGHSVDGKQHHQTSKQSDGNGEPRELGLSKVYAAPKVRQEQTFERQHSRKEDEVILILSHGICFVGEHTTVLSPNDRNGIQQLPVAGGRSWHVWLTPRHKCCRRWSRQTRLAE